MFTDPARALAAARAAVAAGNGATDDASRQATATAHWLEGEALSRLRRDSEAEPIVARALAEAGRRWPDSKLRADLLMTWGSILQNRNKAASALAAFQQAHNLFRGLHDARKQAIALLMIAALYSDAQDGNSALRYYQSALDTYAADSNLQISIYNNRANVLLDMNRVAEAEREYATALRIARATGSPGLLIPMLNNLARVSIRQGRLSAAQAYLDQAYANADRAGADASRAGTDAVSAELAERRGQLARATFYIDRAFSKIDPADTSTWLRDAHEAAYRILERSGRLRDALTHLAAIRQIDNAVSKLAADTNTALMAARFDSTNRDLKIAQLKTDDALRSAELERAHAFFRTALMGGATLLIAIVAGLLGLGYVQISRSRAKIRVANRNLSRSNAALGAALRAKREFLATTSHEFRTPLNGILGMTQLLLVDPELPESARDRVAVLRDAGKAMETLVEDVLDVAALEDGPLTVNAATLDLRALLGQLADVWRQKATEQRLGFSVDLDACPTLIHCDARRIAQVVGHLLSNAVKFTPRGQVSLVARPIAGAESCVEIVVTDTGIGIAQDQHKAIFDKFYQVDTSTSRQYSGIGVGLAIAANAARALKGSIAVESQPGCGTVFRFLLPVALVARPAVRDAELRGFGSRIVLVEPNPITLAMTRQALTHIADRIDAVPTVSAARQALQASETALLLARADLARDAEDLTDLLRTANASGAQSLILLGPADGLEPAQAEAMGASLVLRRPLELPALASAVASLGIARTALAA